MDSWSAAGSFTIELSPAEALLPHTARFTFAKAWTGEIDGASSGVMLSAGDPSSGAAGYVALEHFDGTIAGLRGTVAFQQFGTMSGGTPELRYAVAPGSGTGDLAGVSGTIDLHVVDGVHHVTVRLTRAH